jgi:propanediol utilization protein
VEKGDDEGVSAHGMNVRGSRTQIVNAEGETIIARSAHLSTRDADAIRESADTIDLAVDVDEKAVVVGRMCVSVRKKKSGFANINQEIVPAVTSTDYPSAEQPSSDLYQG